MEAHRSQGDRDEEDLVRPPTTDDMVFAGGHLAGHVA